MSVSSPSSIVTVNGEVATPGSISAGGSIAAIESLFEGEVWTFPDVAHSDREDRFLGIGRTAAGRYVFVAFTIRSRHGARWLRPISARYMHAKEIRHYQAQVARRQN